MKGFLNELACLLKPVTLVDFSCRSFWNSVFFLSKILLVSFFFMVLVYLPTLVSLPGYFVMQMDKFSSLTVQGNFSTIAPVYFPERDGLLVVDTTGMHDDLKKELFLINNKGLKYRFFGGVYEIKDYSFNDVLSNKGSFSLLLSVLALFILPSVFFWLFMFAFLKFLIVILLLCSIFFVLFDLTHFRKSWLQMFNISVFSAIIPIFIETVSMPLSSDYLLLFFDFAGFKLFAVPLILHSILIITLTFALYFAGGKSDSSHC